MEFYTFNLKENNPTVEIAIANLEIEIERGQKYGVKAIKFIHGYGSHGVGGTIRMAVKQYLKSALKTRKIKGVISGLEWTIACDKTFNLLEICPESAYDCDLNSGNLGITIVVL